MPRVRHSVRSDRCADTGAPRPLANFSSFCRALLRSRRIAHEIWIGLVRRQTLLRIRYRSSCRNSHHHRDCYVHPSAPNSQFTITTRLRMVCRSGRCERDRVFRMDAHWTHDGRMLTGRPIIASNPGPEPTLCVIELPAAPSSAQTAARTSHPHGSACTIQPAPMKSPCFRRA